MKEEAQDSTVWRSGCGRVCGPVGKASCSMHLGLIGLGQIFLMVFYTAINPPA